MFGFKQSVNVFSVKFSLPMDPRKFSPSKVYRYTVSASMIRGVINSRLGCNYHLDSCWATIMKCDIFQTTIMSVSFIVAQNLYSIVYTFKGAGLLVDIEVLAHLQLFACSQAWQA